MLRESEAEGDDDETDADMDVADAEAKGSQQGDGRGASERGARLTRRRTRTSCVRARPPIFFHSTGFAFRELGLCL